MGLLSIGSFEKIEELINFPYDTFELIITENRSNNILEKINLQNKKMEEHSRFSRQNCQVVC